jgi:hypothetical protein
MKPEDRDSELDALLAPLHTLEPDPLQARRWELAVRREWRALARKPAVRWSLRLAPVAAALAVGFWAGHWSAIGAEESFEAPATIEIVNAKSY